MSANAKTDQFRLGFLTALDDPERGHVGGLLVTNRFGRPLEFQCTTPVKPNRTQQILYGPTLVPYVLAELIGRTLVEKVSIKPQLILADRAELLDLRNFTEIPVACLNSQSNEPPEGVLKLGNQRLRFHQAHETDRGAVEPHANLIPPEANLQEPFERVREALQETMRLGAAR